MNPGERPSQRLRLLPVAVAMLCGSAILSMVVVGAASTSHPRMLALVVVLADLAKLIGVVALAGHVLARILEQLHLWRTGKVEPSGRDWYEA
jgi:small neutral amino acid transporter SnatA (MarC family)